MKLNINKLKAISTLVVMITTMLTSGCGARLRDLDLIKARGKITVVTNAVFPPFEYYKGEKIEGVDIEISKEIAKDLGLDLEILEMSFDGVVAAIASGKGDFLAAGLTRDSEKEKVISFSDDYIKVIESVITLKQNHNLNNLKALKGHKIGAQIGTASYQYLNNEVLSGIFKNTGTEIIDRKEYLDLVFDLRNHKLDAIFLDGFLAQELTIKNQDLFYFNRGSDSYALAVKKGNDQLLNEINKTIFRLIKTNKINEFFTYHSQNCS